MEEIEVNIKFSKNNKIYYMLIRKSDTILRLKEYCQKISDIPPSEQNLLYKGKILIDEKLIGDYNIGDNHTILLLKKEEPKLEYVPIAQNLNSLKNKKLLDNKDVNYKPKRIYYNKYPRNFIYTLKDMYEEFKNKDKSTSEEEKESKFLEYILPLLYTHLGIEEKAYIYVR